MITAEFSSILTEIYGDDTITLNGDQIVNEPIQLSIEPFTLSDAMITVNYQLMLVAYYPGGSFCENCTWSYTGELPDGIGLHSETGLLSGIPNISVIGLGGLFRESELSFIGQITERALDEIRVDKVIIGIHAIHLELGLTNDYLPEAMTDKAIMKAGNQVIVVTDHTKINTVSAAFLAPVTSIQKLITDHDTSVEFIAALKEKGIEVIVA